MKYIILYKTIMKNNFSEYTDTLTAKKKRHE